MRATTGRPFFIVSSAIIGRDAATTVLAGASVCLQKEVLVDYRLERLLHGGVEAELTQLAHALDGRAAGGEHTAFMSAIGCSELFIASAPLPITVAVAISSAIGLANSARTPASARASMYIKTNAPDAPPRAPNAGNRSSSIWYTLPSDENIASAVFICALVAALPPHIAITEALTLAFMLGITRHNYFSVNIVLEIARFRFYTCTVENEDGQRLEQWIISHRRLNGCIGDFLYLKSLNNEYKLDIQQ